MLLFVCGLRIFLITFGVKGPAFATHDIYIFNINESYNPYFWGKFV